MVTTRMLNALCEQWLSSTVSWFVRWRVSSYVSTTIINILSSLFYRLQCRSINVCIFCFLLISYFWLKDERNKIWIQMNDERPRHAHRFRSRAGDKPVRDGAVRQTKAAGTYGILRATTHRSSSSPIDYYGFSFICICTGVDLFKAICQHY